MTPQQIIDATIKVVAEPITNAITDKGFKAADQRHKRQVLDVLRHAYEVSLMKVRTEIMKVQP